MRSILIAILITVVTQTEAAEFFVLPGTKTLLVMGETKQSDVQALKYHLQDDKVDTLILKGPGGDLVAGYAIADEILKRKLTIIIPANTDCASACSLIFAAGSVRIMEPGSRLGFHLPFMTVSDTDVGEYCAALSHEGKSTEFSSLLIRMKPLTGECLMLTYQMGMRDIEKLSAIFDRDGISKYVMTRIINTPSGQMAWIDPMEARIDGLTSEQ